MPFEISLSATERSNRIAAFLVDLEAAKEHGIISAQIITPPWVGSDSEDATAECGVCSSEEVLDRMRLCTCCGEFYCDNADATCTERHVAHVKGERWG